MTRKTSKRFDKCPIVFDVWIQYTSSRVIGQFKPRIGTAAFSTLLLKIDPESKELVHFVNDYGTVTFRCYYIPTLIQKIIS